MNILLPPRLSHSQSTWRGSPLIHVIAHVSVSVWRWSEDIVGLRPLLGRMTSHIAVGLIFLLLFTFGNVRWESIAAASEAISISDPEAAAKSNADTTPIVSLPYYRSFQGIVKSVAPHTAIPNRPRLEITTYTVQSGDTAETIAQAFGLQPTTLMWSNSEMEKSPDLLRVGQELVILPIDGAYHTVESGDTLESLAETYEVDVEAIIGCAFNSIAESGELVVGQKVIVPGGVKPYKTQEVATYAGPTEEVEASGSGVFLWPAAGYLTQGYWYGHRAIDIGGSIGVPIYAADGGYVSFAGWTDIGYGYLVVVDHTNGYQSYYAHLSGIYVVEGEGVTAGEVIGAMGSTGWSTGPHLHFEIRYDGYPTNPLIFLP